MLDRHPSPNAAGDTDSDTILAFLTTRQHLHPHARLDQVMTDTIERFACCAIAVARALEWLRLDGGSAIGRLRRSELVQLARVIHRFWSQAGEPSTAAH